MAVQAPTVERQTYNLDEVAKLLGIGLVTVERLVASGELPSFKIRNRRLVHRLTMEGILAMAEAGDPNPIKTVREGLVAKHPALFDGTVDVSSYSIKPIEDEV